LLRPRSRHGLEYIIDDSTCSTTPVLMTARSRKSPGGFCLVPARVAGGADRAGCPCAIATHATGHHTNAHRACKRGHRFHGHIDIRQVSVDAACRRVQLNSSGGATQMMAVGQM
jgi:hypothetical protein